MRSFWVIETVSDSGLPLFLRLGRSKSDKLQVQYTRQIDESLQFSRECDASIAQTFLASPAPEHKVCEHIFSPSI